MHPHALDHAAQELATGLHAMAPAGDAPRGAQASPHNLAAELRPYMTPENVAAATVNGKFNLHKFLENLGNVYNVVAPLIGIISTFTGHPITLPPITIPTSPTP